MYYICITIPATPLIQAHPVGFLFIFMHFNKPALTTNQQLELLLQRGLHVDNIQKAIEILSNISYYRLGAYTVPFQEVGSTEHTFVKGTTFEQILNLYEFDRNLRLLVFDAIERIEVAFRTQIIYEFSISIGPYWFEKEELFLNSVFYKKNLGKLDFEINRSLEVFIQHFQKKYTSPNRPPAWMSLEVSSFGLMSKIFKNIKPCPEKKNVSRHFGVNYKVLESWTESISYVRNICAHHSSLWNKKLTLTPLNPTYPHFKWLENCDIDVSRTYMLLSCIIYLLERINLNSDFKKNLVKLLTKNTGLDLNQMGFHTNWYKEQLWKQS